MKELTPREILKNQATFELADNMYRIWRLSIDRPTDKDQQAMDIAFENGATGYSIEAIDSRLAIDLVLDRIRRDIRRLDAEGTPVKPIYRKVLQYADKATYAAFDRLNAEVIKAAAKMFDRKKSSYINALRNRRGY